jgi:hypothetical protein
MKYIVAIFFFISGLSFMPSINLADAQIPQCRYNNTCHQGKSRTRVSHSVAVIDSKSDQGFCVGWMAEPLPGVFRLQNGNQLNSRVTSSASLSRGNLENAPESIIVDYKHNGLILHQYADFGLAKGRGDFIGTIPKARAENVDGCTTKIDYERVSFDLEADTDGNFVRVTLNRREDGMIAIRLVEITSVGNNEIARYVYKRKSTPSIAELRNARIGELATQINFVPSSAIMRVVGASQKRTRGSRFNVATIDEVCTVAASDDESVSEDYCGNQENWFVVTEPTGN